MKRILINPNRQHFRPRLMSQAIKSEIPYVVDFSLSASDRSTTVSSMSAESKGPRALTLTTPSVASGVGTFYASSDWAGQGEVQVKATYADGKEENAFIRIEVYNPTIR